MVLKLLTLWARWVTQGPPAGQIGSWGLGSAPSLSHAMCLAPLPPAPFCSRPGSQGLGTTPSLSHMSGLGSGGPVPVLAPGDQLCPLLLGSGTEFSTQDLGIPVGPEIWQQGSRSITSQLPNFWVGWHGAMGQRLSTSGLGASLVASKHWSCPCTIRLRCSSR